MIQKYCILIIFLLIPLINVFSESYFDLKGVQRKHEIQFEKKRNLCIFPLQNETGESKYQYLENGISSLLFSSLRNVAYVFDQEVLVESVEYPMHNPDSKNDPYQLEQDKKFNFIKGQDPRFIELHVLFLSEKKIENENLLYYYGRENNCFYILYGTFRKMNELEIKIESVFFNRKNGENENFETKASIRKIYSELGDLGSNIKKYLIGKNICNINFEVLGSEEPYIFLNGDFLGKAPLKNYQVIPGVYELEIYKEGFHKIQEKINLCIDTIEPKKAIINTSEYKFFSYTLLPVQKEGNVSVQSKPEGAKVFVGDEYIGETPIESYKVKSGINRIRLKKEGFIDYFKGVEIVSGKPFFLQAKLKEGDTKKHYINKKFLFLDYTYHDFSIYSMYSSLIFIGMYYYFNVQANQVIDETRPEIYFVNLLAITQASNSMNQADFLAVYYYEDIKIKQAIRKRDRYRSYSGYYSKGELKPGFALFGFAFSLTVSGLFYFLGLQPDFVNFGFYLDKTNYTTSANANLEFKLRF